MSWRVFFFVPQLETCQTMEVVLTFLEEAISQPEASRKRERDNNAVCQFVIETFASHHIHGTESGKKDWDRKLRQSVSRPMERCSCRSQILSQERKFGRFHARDTTHDVSATKTYYCSHQKRLKHSFSFAE